MPEHALCLIISYLEPYQLPPRKKPETDNRDAERKYKDLLAASRPRYHNKAPPCPAKFYVLINIYSFSSSKLACLPDSKTKSRL